MGKGGERERGLREMGEGVKENRELGTWGILR